MRDYSEKWLTIAEAAEYWGCGERSIKYALADGMPNTRIFGRPKILASEAEPWLIANGHATVVAGSDNGPAAAPTAPAPDTED
jgi:hypothetical protein